MSKENSELLNGWLQLYKELGGHLTYNKVFVKNNKVVGWR